ncbi:MAG: UDP-2,3-diacylglucosamine diphosphatase [Microscillaceae bacterium]|nr:UDP-2,3-diacylglucosamine diphosphatase [Microscillaceae bacterium]
MPNEHHIELPAEKKIFFASDFHLGAPNPEVSKQRERIIVQWLTQIQTNAHCIFLVGDIFDFWFEYKYVIPKGFIRFQGKIAELVDKGIQFHLFTGNHDLWMFGYFTQELGIPIYTTPQTFIINNKTKILIGHGDGLGPGDYNYKRIKKIFTNPLAQWLFKQLHPDWGVALAQFWSSKSRAKNAHLEEKFLGEREQLWQYCKAQEQKKHHDFYIFGHRHLAVDIEIAPNSRYINLGEWFKRQSFAYLENTRIYLTTFQP